MFKIYPTTKAAVFVLVVGYSFLLTSVSAQNFYEKRLERFQRAIASKKTVAEKKSFAVGLAKNPTSEFSKDAIRLLAEMNAEDTIVDLVSAAKKRPEIRDEVIVAIGDMPTKEGVDYLIEVLDDDRENTRSIAIKKLRDVTNQNFDYWYDDPKPKRLAARQNWQTWWNKNRETFQPAKLDRDTKGDADEAWERYGKKYLNSN